MGRELLYYMALTLLYRIYFSFGENPISHASNSSEWFSLDGRKWDSKPKAKGIYVNNGQKVVIK